MLCRANGPFQAAAFIIEGSTGASSSCRGICALTGTLAKLMRRRFVY